MSKFSSHATSCVSCQAISATALSELPAFFGAISGSRNKVVSEAILKQVVAETHEHGSLSHAKVQRARDMVKKKLENGCAESYTSQIGSLCSEIIDYKEYVVKLIRKVDSIDYLYYLKALLEH